MLTYAPPLWPPLAPSPVCFDIGQETFGVHDEGTFKGLNSGPKERELGHEPILSSVE